MTLQLTDHDAIRLTLARYNWCGDNGDLEGFAATFAEDGVLDIKDRGKFSGSANILEAARNRFGAAPEQVTRLLAAGRSSHHLSTIRIELVDANRAHCWAYFSVHCSRGPDHWGRYTDQLARIGDQWLFSYRRVSVDGYREDSAFRR